MPVTVVVDCRHMEPHEIHTAADTAAIEPTNTDVSRDLAPTSVPTPPHTAPTVLRHHFTLTVEQVSSELYLQGFGRDDRTIQRWCKAGKLSAIVDEVHGDRYLIDPLSLRDMLTTLAAERDSRTARPFMSSRPVEPVATTPRPPFDTAPSHGHSAEAKSYDTRPDEAPAQTRHTASEEGEAATLKQRIAELERANAMLTIDKQVREQMVDYMKEQFGTMLDQALDRSMEVGQLKSEVAHLRAQLPAPTPVSPHGHEPHRFTPQHVRHQTETVHNEQTWERSLEV